MSKALTKPMQETLAALKANGNMTLHFDRWFAGAHGNFSRATIEALVSRGVAEYTEWRDGRFGMAKPVEVRPASRPEPEGEK